MEKPIQQLWAETTFDDMWDDHSDLLQVIRYLRDSKRLKLPEAWRPLLPTSL